jgi:phenylacetate-CoA ligase
VEGETISRSALEAEQLQRLRFLLAELLSHGNPFWAPRLRAVGLEKGIGDIAEFCEKLPRVTKAELVDDHRLNPPFGSNLTYPLKRYSRYHQTSGTTGAPLRWLDTEESWQAQLETWKKVFRVAGVGPEDRLFVPFSFGPFLGFWTAFEAAKQLGCLTIPGGGMDSKGRLEVMLASGATAFCATPTYAIRLAEVAVAEGIDLECAKIQRIIVAGEPGGSVPAVRARLAQLWSGAEVFDHHGMTEVGPVSFPNPRRPGILHIHEPHFLAEILDPESGRPVSTGKPGELVLTTMMRSASPLLRYRTGDLVVRSRRPVEELGFVEMALEGGILSRVDDMVVVRGVNLYPSAVDEVVRSLGDVAEYRVILETGEALSEVRVEVEPGPSVAASVATEAADVEELARRVEGAFRQAFQLRIPVKVVPRGALPRFELKAKRWSRG